MADDCIFCKIVAGEIPAQRVDEDERTIAFMDLNPWTRGHALVIPREHSANLYEIGEADLAATGAGDGKASLTLEIHQVEGRRPLATPPACSGTGVS